MDILQAKQIVIDAGIKLVETGLIARTWGNVSCRIDENSFVITPSGKPYIGLTPDDIVEVKIVDLSYSGDVKPSSEKGVHAEVYKAHPDANFVIHTHQKNASIVSVLKDGIPSIDGKSAEIIGSKVLNASYGMPGTGKLRKGVADALAACDSKAIIMAHHGAVCFGKDCEEAFAVVQELEKVCEKYILLSAAEKLNVVCETLDDFCKAMPKILCKDDKIRVIDCGEKVVSVYNRANGEISFKQPDSDDYTSALDVKTGDAAYGILPGEALLHRDIYAKREEINAIIHNTDTEVVALSAIGKTIKPLLDDFSQIVGTKVKTTDIAKAPKALKGRNAVLIKNKGALCCGGNLSDAEAVDMIMSKAAVTYFGASVFGKPKKLSPIDSKIMNVVYKLKYSKQADKK